MKSFTSFCEQHSTNLLNWSTLAQEYREAPELFEAFVFFYEQEAEYRLNELNLGGRLGRWLGRNQTPEQPNPDYSAYQQKPLAGAAQQNFQMALRDLRSYYPMGDTPQDSQARHNLLKDPKRIKEVMPKLDNVIRMSQRLGFDAGVQRWSKVKDVLSKQVQAPTRADTAGRADTARFADRADFANKAGGIANNPATQNNPAAQNNPAQNDAPQKAGVGIAGDPQDKGMNVQQVVQQAVISSKTISDTLNKIIGHSHIRQWFRGDKSQILNNLVQSWNAFKGEVKNMQKDPRFPAPQKATPTPPAINGVPGMSWAQGTKQF